MSEVGDISRPTSEHNQTQENPQRNLTERTAEFFDKHKVDWAFGMVGAMEFGRVMGLGPGGAILGFGIGVGVSTLARKAYT